MACTQKVKEYLAYWFQLGKKVSIRNGDQLICPATVIQNNKYSAEFEACWEQIMSIDSGDCYLQGTCETIKELLEPSWEIIPCARCFMPIATRTLGLPPLFCPCVDLPNWPNNELPCPRGPINSQNSLSKIHHRLLKHKESE